MFKNKNYLTPQILLTIYNQSKVTCLYGNKNNSNVISLKLANSKALTNKTIEFSKTQLMDIGAVNYNSSNIKNTIFFNYMWDIYINIIDIKKTQQSSSTT